MGILDLLDEESRLPAGTDENLIVKLYNQFSTGATTNTFFGKPRFGQKQFIVKHYAIDVEYTINGFIEKNKDSVTDDQLELLSGSTFPFFVEVVSPQLSEEEIELLQVAKETNKKQKKSTLSSQFKDSLIKLMSTLRETNPHYIRCIKPNQAKKAFEFESPNVLSQLIACGVLETIKISRAGYPSKLTFQHFSDRYYLLVNSSNWKLPPLILTTKICDGNIKGVGKYELGTTKIFFRAGQLAYLEKLRSEKMTMYIISIQKNVRRHLTRRKYMLKKTRIVKIQALIRGRKTRNCLRVEKRVRAATTIQKFTRGVQHRRKFLRVRESTKKIQKCWRKFTRKRSQALTIERFAVIKIQSAWRMYTAKLQFKREVRLVIFVQSCLRRRKARSEFKKLRSEARSFGNLKQVNYKLEAKIVELSQRVNGNLKENADVLEKIHTLESQVSAWKERFMKLENEAKAKASENTEVLDELKKKYMAAVVDRDTISKDCDKSQAMVRKRDDQLLALQAEVQASKDELTSMAGRFRQIELSKQVSMAALGTEDASHAALQKEVISLREQMARLVAGKYATDQKTELFLNNDYVPPASIVTRNAMSFLESAAQVTAQVAESWIGTSTLAHRPTFSSSINSTEAAALRQYDTNDEWQAVSKCTYFSDQLEC